MNRTSNEPILEMGMVLLGILIPGYSVFYNFLVKITKFSHFWQFLTKLHLIFAFLAPKNLMILEKYPIHCVAELFSFLEWTHLYFDHV